ncbi:MULTISPECIES: hypothetical protein [Hyphobacterium]|uniref:DUF805 domain-containing protein n=1 Tax=Hyphobacterium vulgare TaxID=1736751 RepID=A0ABV6ZWQ0_9PROT
MTDILSRIAAYGRMARRERRKNGLMWFGLVLTISYLAFVLPIVVPRLGELDAMSLNEIGDFLAGLFGPAAFLWLVLGFLQQASELRIQSEELRATREQGALQAEALQKSAALAQTDHVQRRFREGLENLSDALEDFVRTSIATPAGYPDAGKLRQRMAQGDAEAVFRAFADTKAAQQALIVPAADASSDVAAYLDELTELEAFLTQSGAHALLRRLHSDPIAQATGHMKALSAEFSAQS